MDGDRRAGTNVGRKQGSVIHQHMRQEAGCRTAACLFGMDCGDWCCQWPVMSDRTFRHLNDAWNAEPNDPAPDVQVSGSDVTLRFKLNPWAYEASPTESGVLTFCGCSKWRLGSPNDEGWFAGQCRYSSIAPAWGEFYEILGLDPLAHTPTDWRATNQTDTGKRHFLFYLHNETFECFADEWTFSRLS